VSDGLYRADPPPDTGAARQALAAFDPGRRGVRALAVVVVLVAAAAAGFVWWSRPTPVPVTAATVTVSDPPGESTGVVVVSVAGRVHRPGLVRLPSGARVADAIEAAGGPLPGTDLAYVNLARRVVDGELILIGVSAPPAVPGGSPPPGPLNLNTATLAQLDALPGVGPVLAQRIIDYRTRTGGFRSVAELRRVEGFGDAKFADVKDLVTV
jgi:competence protein ComEA